MLILRVICVLLISPSLPLCSADLFQVQTDEVFMIPLSPQWFNLSSAGRAFLLTFTLHFK